MDGLVVFEILKRSSICFEALGIDDTAMRLGAVFMATHPHFASTTTLLHETCIPRPTIIRRLKDMEKVGWVEKHEDGRTSYRTTPGLHQLGVDIGSQVHQLTLGQRRGFSHDLITRLRKVGVPVQDHACTIWFPPLKIV